MLAFWWVVGCKRKDPEPVMPPPVADAPVAVDAAPGDGVEVLLRALSVRDEEPSCPSLDALVPDPVAALTEIADTVSMPPAAPMRAARCLILTHAEAAEPAITRWMGAADTEGFVRLVVADWSNLPVPVAVRLAQAGLAGPHRALVADALQAATVPELRAIAP